MEKQESFQFRTHHERVLVKNYAAAVSLPQVKDYNFNWHKSLCQPENLGINLMAKLKLIKQCRMKELKLQN